MTTLAARPVDDALASDLRGVADPDTPIGKLHADDFRRACEEDGRAHSGWVNPSRVSRILHDRFGELNPRWLSSSWAHACGKNGFMDKTSIWVPIDPTYSRGNGAKDVRLRRLRDLASPDGEAGPGGAA